MFVCGRKECNRQGTAVGGLLFQMWCTKLELRPYGPRSSNYTKSELRVFMWWLFAKDVVKSSLLTKSNSYGSFIKQLYLITDANLPPNGGNPFFLFAPRY